MVSFLESKTKFFQEGVANLIEQLDTIELGACLTKCRLMMGMSRKAASEAMGIGPAMLTQYEYNISIPGPLALKKIFEFYGLPLERADGMVLAAMKKKYDTQKMRGLRKRRTRS